MGDSPALNDTERLVQRLLRGLQQRALLGPTDAARVPLEMNLVAQLKALSASLEGTVAAPGGAAPPRRVGVAMALALHSQPHLAAIFSQEERDGTIEVNERGPFAAEPPFVAPNEVLESALGLSQWELDDLREEIDRRAGAALKQQRGLAWIWSHFGLPAARPAPLFRVLFPAQDRLAGSAALVRRGARLYALLDVPKMPLPSLYLGWMGAEQEGAAPPLASFRAKYVDHGLRRSLARGIGAEPWEIDGILDKMVVLVPRDSAVAFLERDRWRISGLSSVTWLGDDYLGAEKLIAPAEREELQWTRWIGASDGKVEIRRAAKALFDEFALERAQAMMEQVYAGLLARVEELDEGDEAYKAEDLDLFDVARHLRAALTPLVEWARSDGIAAQIAIQLQVDPAVVSKALDPLANEWERHLEARWLAAPSAGRRHTIVALLMAHLVALRSSLVRMALREPDRRWEHRSLALLFAAHYLADAPIERLWLKGLSDMMVDSEAPLPPAEDIVGCWFWTTWQRVLAASEFDPAPSRTPEIG